MKFILYEIPLECNVNANPDGTFDGLDIVVEDGKHLCSRCEFRIPKYW